MHYPHICLLKVNSTKKGIPLLKDVLKLVDGQVPLLIEIKGDTPVGQLEEKLIKLLDSYEGKYAIQSFNPYRVGWFKDNRPNVIRGQLSGTYHINSDKSWMEKQFLEDMKFKEYTKPDFMNYELKGLNNKEVVKLKDKNISILTWTMYNNSEINNDEIIFDNIVRDMGI